MKSYTSATLIASLAGWLVAILVYIAGSYLSGNKEIIGAFYLVGYLTFFYSVLFNIGFFQLLHYFAKKYYFQTNKFIFAATTSVIAFSVLALISGATGQNLLEQLAYVNASVNGYILGLIFHSVWKPTELSV